MLIVYIIRCVQVFPSSFIYSLSEAGDVVASTPRDLFTAANLKKFDCAWTDKVNTAFFRGTATGECVVCLLSSMLLATPQ